MTNQPDVNTWILVPKPKPAARLRLFCLPYAGGSPTMFRTWPDAFGDAVEVALVLLPGRGARYYEAPLTDLRDAVKQASVGLAEKVDLPYVVFGHSLGALIGYELIHALREQSLPEPLRFIPCARAAPHLPDARLPLHKLPDALFVKEVQRRYGGIPQAILDDAEMLQLFLPMLRADLQMLETYDYRAHQPLDCAIRAYGAYQDSGVTQTHLNAWAEHTTGDFQSQLFPGDHFFVQSSTSFLQFLVTELDRLALTL